MNDPWMQVAHSLGHLRDTLRRMAKRQQQLVRLSMAQNDDIVSAEDAFDALLTSLLGAFDADNKLIVDLKAQLAAGQPGLTADQGNAILARLVANQKTVSDALAAAAPSAPSTPSVPPAAS